MRELFKAKAREVGIIIDDDDRQVMHVRKEHFEKYSELIHKLGRDQEAAMWKLQQWNEENGEKL